MYRPDGRVCIHGQYKGDIEGRRTEQMQLSNAIGFGVRGSRRR